MSIDPEFYNDGHVYVPDDKYGQRLSDDLDEIFGQDKIPPQEYMDMYFRYDARSQTIKALIHSAIGSTLMGVGGLIAWYGGDELMEAFRHLH